MGSDVARSIILFAEGKPLGSDGLRHLKVHVVNLTDLKKKASIDERAKYADEIMDDILDSADRPLSVCLIFNLKFSLKFSFRVVNGGLNLKNHGKH